MTRLILMLARQAEAAPLQLAATVPSPTAVGTAPAPTPGTPAPGVGAHSLDDSTDGPTVADLEAIEAEWPVIAAEVALVDAECHYLAHPSTTTRAAVRAAEAAAVRAHLLFALAHPTSIGDPR